ncbi:hypothetical protein ACSVC9_00635 [Clostridium sp. LBM24168]
MYNSDPSSLSFLDNVRNSKGPDDLRDFFTQLSRQNPDKADTFINDKKLQFSTLFILKDEIEKVDLLRNLNQRNKAALLIVKKILLDKGKNTLKESLSFSHIHVIHSALKWILKSGFSSDGMNDEYDRVLDITCAILTKIYKDNTLLPIMADMIFERYRKGFLIHDLTWAFFQSASPESLIIIGERLLSQEKKDVEIACKLLNFIPGMNDDTSSAKKYTNFLNWMKENSAFLKYTGESFQQTPNPTPYRVVLEGKYLCKNICCDTGKAFCSPSNEEHKLLEEFKKLDGSTKVLLSNFSLKIHNRNIYLWDLWRHSSLEDQIKIARMGGVQ